MQLKTIAFVGSGFAPTGHHVLKALIDFFVLSASETELLLVVKLRCNDMMMRAGIKIMHQVMFDAL